MSFSVDIRSIDELVDGTDDPLHGLVVQAYGNQPLPGRPREESMFQFSYQAVPPEATDRVLGELAEGDPMGLMVEELPPADLSDPFAPEFFSVLKLARELEAKYPDVAKLDLATVYEGLSEGMYTNEQTLAAVLMDFARNPLPGYPVVVFLW